MSQQMPKLPAPMPVLPVERPAPVTAPDSSKVVSEIKSAWYNNLSSKDEWDDAVVHGMVKADPGWRVVSFWEITERAVTDYVDDETGETVKVKDSEIHKIRDDVAETLAIVAWADARIDDDGLDRGYRQRILPVIVHTRSVYPFNTEWPLDYIVAPDDSVERVWNENFETILKHARYEERLGDAASIVHDEVHKNGEVSPRRIKEIADAHSVFLKGLIQWVSKGGYRYTLKNDGTITKR